MRIVTRPDFDGVVCAVLLKKALQITSSVYWTEPNEIQSETANIKPGDVMANLPYSPECSLWFDHHISNKPDTEVPGAFEIAPSAARVVYQYYSGKLEPEFDELVHHTDIIDSADLDKDQVQYPEKYPYILLSMTLKNENYKDIQYWNHLVDLLAENSIEKVHQDPQVKEKCRQVIEENNAWEAILRKHTRVTQQISITDFRGLDKVPGGNRFLSYCIFPESIASLQIRYGGPKRDKVQISVGASIFNRRLNVNIGRLLSQFGGGGHKGAGGCTLDARTADEDINRILDVLFANEK